MLNCDAISSQTCEQRMHVLMGWDDYNWIVVGLENERCKYTLSFLLWEKKWKGMWLSDSETSIRTPRGKTKDKSCVLDQKCFQIISRLAQLIRWVRLQLGQDLRSHDNKVVGQVGSQELKRAFKYNSITVNLWWAIHCVCMQKLAWLEWRTSEWEF